LSRLQTLSTIDPIFTKGVPDMATLLRMPEVAANATHARLAGWHKKEGEAVAVGDCLADVETDKAVIELSAEVGGVVGKLLVAAGEEVEVGAPIAVLLAAGEPDVDVATSAAAARGSAPSPMQAAPENPAGRVFASPLARRLGEQRGIDLASLRGSGPNGRIVKRDVDAASAIGQAVTSAPARQPGAVAVEAPSPAYREVPHSNMRRTIARRLFESKSTIPHFYLGADCRMDRLLALRAEINAAAPRKISVNDFIVRAVAVALRDVPGANVGWTETAMRHYAHADIAVAVSTDTGLLTPIVRNADSKPLSVISAEIADLAARARAGQLRPEEYQGGGFSVSNLGMYGVAEFSAIINPPQAAILAVGATQQLPVVDSGVLAVGTVMRCTLSVDHRAIDGALAGEWLAAFKHVIETPLAMLV
jgi:pyruvate dehydrogenase E2 component (dihydrolipoamide acetyltransferase)